MSMSRKTTMKTLFAAFMILAAIGCSKDEPKPTPGNDDPVEELQPMVEVEVGAITTNSLTFTISVDNAKSITYLLTEGTTPADTERVLAESEVTEEHTITCEDLTPYTDYTVTVVATNVEKQACAYASAKTEAEPIPTPGVTVALREGDVTERSLSFYVASTEADVLKWVCIEDGSRDVTAAQVLANGTEAEANTESEVVVEGLKSNTAYAIYAAATCNIEGFEPVLAEKLVMTTAEPEPVGYHMSDTTKAIAEKTISTLDNYFVIFTDEANGYTLRCDFYTAAGSTHLPSGTYTLGDTAEGALNKNFTTFMFTPSDSEMTEFESGSVTVNATPNEETREVEYAIEGLLYFANGDFVTLNFRGQIGGIMLPKPTPEIPDVPEGATIFTPDPETKMPERLHTGAIEVGEYYIKFYDKDWNELVLDIMLDPATCNNGKDGLPAGTYTMDDGTIDGYSNITIYSPYFGERFTEAELTVSVEGEEYELTFIGTAGSGSSAKVFYMYYKGEILDMVQQ